MNHFHIPKNVAEWVENSLLSGRNILATSNQGTLLLFREVGIEFVVKTAMGSGAMRKARQATLMREYQAYRRMEGLSGIPRCYGMVADRYLLMEYVRGQPFRDAQIEDREAWFERLLEIIQGFHRRGVSHGDLKSKSNLMVTDRGEPCVLDFGTACIFKQGFHPINQRLFKFGQRLDLNAWVKHKYEGHYERASEEDRQYLDYSRLENLLRRWRNRKS